MLSIYMDEHVRVAITEGLRRRGVHVITAQDDHHDHTPDLVVLDRVQTLGCILFTQDEDFLIEAQHRQAQGSTFPGIVYAHQLNMIIGRCIDELELVAKTSSLADLQNTVTYLPL